MMKRVTFGKTGEQVSEMCLGTMMFGDQCDEAESRRILSAALDQGIHFIDTAPLYMEGLSEEILGRWLKGRRDKVFLVSKVRIDLIGVTESIEQSLRRLDTDHLDLYMIHAPMAGMNHGSIMEELNQVVQAGKTRYVGCSNYPAWLVSSSNGLAREHGWPELVCNQIPYNLIERGIEMELLQQSYAEDIALMIYRPLCFGLLAGRYRPGTPLPKDSRAVADGRIPALLERLSQEISGFLDMAEEWGVPPATLALSWLRKHPAVTTPIVGVSSLRQLQENVKAFTFELTDEQYEQLNALFEKTEVQEVSGGLFGPLRRDLGLVQRAPRGAKEDHRTTE